MANTTDLASLNARNFASTACLAVPESTFAELVELDERLCGLFVEVDCPKAKAACVIAMDVVSAGMRLHLA